jgi:MFS transporter, ACS family, hexuronate transporter
MIALVFLATMINYLDRQTLSVAAPVVREEFHMSNSAYGAVVFAFMLAYTIMNGLSGLLIDHLGTRLGYALSIAWWSVAAMLHAAARGPISLGLCRFLLGMGEAGNWPAGIKVVAEWFPERERALASGLFNSGSSVGAILAPPLVAWILLQFGWRWAFGAVGAAGLLWLLLWWPCYRTPALVPERKAPLPVRKLFRNRFVLMFMLAKVFLDPVWYFYIFWFPEYLKAARHFDMASIGRLAWIPFLLAGFGNVVGGAFTALLVRFGFSTDAALKWAVTVFGVCMAAAIPAVLVNNVWLSIACVSLAMIGYTGSLANLLAFPAAVFPGDLVGSVFGIASMGAGFGGMVFALITGWMVDRYSYTPVFFGFGCIPFIGLFIIWQYLGPLQQRAEFYAQE